jgi:hypothetical protein
MEPHAGVGFAGRLRRVAAHLCVNSALQADAAAAAPKLLRLAFVGCGQICHAHLNGINALAAGRVVVTACIDRSVERAEELAGLVAAGPAGHGARPAAFESLEARHAWVSRVI